MLVSALTAIKKRLEREIDYRACRFFVKKSDEQGLVSHNHNHYMSYATLLCVSALAAPSR